MSELILSGIETARPSRRHRLAARAKARAESPAPPKLRQLPGIKGAGIGMSPIGPALIIQFEDGQGAPMPLTPNQARELGTGLITVAGHWELLKKMHADQAAAEQPVPTNPDMEVLLAEAQAKTASPILLSEEFDGDDGEGVDDMPSEPAPNSFDINGRPVYEPPADESE